MSPLAIAVIEATALVCERNERDTTIQRKSEKLLPILNIVLETETQVISLVRYIPDLVEFDQLIKTHYHNVKIPFPNLIARDLTSSSKRHTLRYFLTTLTHTRQKTNAQKIEMYLRRCARDTTVQKSTLFRDFLLPQREDDYVIHKQTVDSVPDSQLVTITDTAPDDDGDPVSKQFGSIDNEPVAVQPNNPGHPDQPNQTESSDREPSVTVDTDVDVDVDVNPNESDTQAKANPYPLADQPPESTGLAPPQQPPHVPLDNLEMLKVLGKGCMGKVFLVQSRHTRQLYALKSIPKQLVVEQREITHTLAEREILETLSLVNHPFLAKLHTSFQDSHRLYLLTDYHCGGDLATQMSSCATFAKELTLFYAAEIIEGIGELHRHGILYRDLKPENILLTMEGHVVLTDFGLSKWLDNDDRATHTFCGTAEYLAPEVLLGEPYSFGIDHWAYGTILYEMLAGITPFWADNHSDMYRRVLEEPLEFPPDVDYDTAEFIAGLLDRDPQTRLGAHGVDEIKSHYYFAHIDWDDVYHRRLVPPYVPPLASEMDFANFDISFLEMEPALTPMSSQVDLTSDIQQVFENYSFTDVRYLENEWPHSSTNDFTGAEHELNHEPNNDYRETDTNAEPVVVSPVPPKRGSISMLSDGSDEDRGAKDPTDTALSDEHHEGKRSAKRRNTQREIRPNLLPEPSPVDPDPLPDLSIASSVDASLDELGFSLTSELDLRFSFDLPDHSSSTYQCTSPMDVHKKNRKRRLFSPFHKFLNPILST
ncbi:kinase-like domain-containing protein [Radiomyces spectabilis]|uniref:kinase-like domain-containing protein n=1 Tax=Radiomyces spectabilis TaxID=64574 RepID=UPI00221F18DA|nr:kinase-like domain-containing protein [Radiomyces spectabilis]KAI8365987.1 kinase-like domain-containing protein [Radiomyces spectabilis]